ncbi:MAG: isoprenylcysteine carboxylmethyltransferase family protein [Oscillospiraceae bacterium]
MDNNLIFNFLDLSIICGVCLWLLLSAIVLSFYFSNKSHVKKVKKSIVETGSMLAFFIVMVFLAYKKIGTLNINLNTALIIALFGTLLIVFGTIINIIGRVNLKGNWGNQIKIYENHTLTKTGLYKYIRHPLYSSTILMLYGFSFLFVNPFIFFLNTIVFIPLMILRAKQEDKMLHMTFQDEFLEYKSQTGLFLIKLRKRGQKND